MNKFNFYYLLIILLIINFVYGCAKVRDSAGVNRKSPDEFRAIENPPLVIPPDYSLVPPDQLQERDIGNIEKEIAEEILFGLEEIDTIEKNQLSTMNQILSEANAENTSDTIRDEIDENFANEMSFENDFQINWEDEQEVLDAVKESERIRENNFNEKSILERDIPIKKQKIKKKRKRFFIF